MRKELVISCTPHETRVAILEEGQLCEIYIEREKEYALVGSIYKGRVTRVLPGMQSAFVDIGLDTDAFLYVSDVLEDLEEYDQGGGTERAASAVTEASSSSAPSSSPPTAHAPSRNEPSRGERRRFSLRRPRRHGRELPAAKFAQAPPAEHYVPVILPGESLAKYKDRLATPVSEEPAAGPTEEASAPQSQATTETSAWAEPPESPEANPAPTESHPAEQPAVVETASVTGTSADSTPATMEGLSAEEPPESASVGEGKEEATAEAAATVSEVGELTPEEAAALTETLAEVRQAEALGEAESATAGAGEAEPGEGDVEAEPRPAQVEAPSVARLQRPARRGHPLPRRLRSPRRRPAPAAPRRTQQIGELLKPGQEVIVQITKEPLGKKGARITTHITLPGRFLVYMPTLDHVGVSRKIGSAERRARLRRLVDSLRNGHPGGFIVRTAAETASEDDLRADAEFLIHTWQDIRAKAEQRKVPALLHRDLNLVERTLRDCLTREFTAIWVDSEEQYTRVLEFVGRFQPELVNRVKLYTKETPLFEEMGIQQEIEKALRPKVWLKSGGYIVINHTEALVAIDVNTGKYVGRGSNRLEDTIVKTNIEAVKEIVRQIRLRDLGGIIVIDFIDMEERKNREKVLQALEEALRADRAPSKVLPFNEFGLVAITRKRTKQALERVLCQPCPYCTGSGMVKSVTTICYEIDAEVRKMAPEMDSPSMTLRVHPEIAKALKTRESHVIEELERYTGKSIVIQSDPTLHWEHYDIY